MKKPALQEVTCPHCHATQSEPASAISTNCKSCGKYFKLGGKSEARASRAPKETREVFCVKCGAPNLVSTSALSTQCIRCSHYLELGNKVVKGVQIGKLYAYDDVLFAEGCSFKGMEATGRNMEVRGKVFSKLRATEEIVAMPGSNISGELHALGRADRARGHGEGAGARMRAVAGQRCGGDYRHPDGLGDYAERRRGFLGPAAYTGVEADDWRGGHGQFDAITCDEITVEGQVTLGTSLAAEKVTVRGAGTLTSPVVRAASVEVSPGGSLQTKIEKHVPRETPKPKEPEPRDEPEDPDETQAEAA